MGWATAYIEQLQSEDKVEIEFQPKGNSMTPLIESGELVKITNDFKTEDLKKGDIVLCKVDGKQYLHKITAIRTGANYFMISNNHGHENGWVHRKKIYGLKIK